MWKRLVLGIFVVLSIQIAYGQGQQGIEDTPFVQEYHEPYPIEPGGPANDVRAVAVDKAGRVWAATRAGVHALRDDAWSRVEGVTDGQTFDLFVDADGAVWVASWDGVYVVAAGSVRKIPEVEGPVAIVGPAENGVVILGPNDAWRCQGKTCTAIPERMSRAYRDATTGPDETLWVATGMGLYNLRPEGMRHYYRNDELVSGEVNGVAFAADGRLWAGGLGGVTVLENGTCVQQMTGKNGPPYPFVNCTRFAPDGTLWAGTDLGVARWNGGPYWSLRHSRRWLLSDRVRDIAFDDDGTAWVATDAGVSAIKRRTMTLAEKADYYYAICMERHVRAPWLVEKCRFPDPTDRSVWEPVDDDNDGEYTSFYLVMECFRYAATKDPDAKAKADKAYDALEFLQTVTGTDGFVARSVVPATQTKMADPNEDYSVARNAGRMIGDARWKPVSKRWRLSADGKWLWKGDTSSDEITGHMFAYYFYYELAADEAHKERVRRHVANIVDHIVDNGYVFRDPVDGQPTRWGVWAPEMLQNDPDWRVEMPINSFEILSYLKTAHHITGDDKYDKEYRKLIEEHGYAEATRRPKAIGLSERSHIDDGLLLSATPALVLNEKDPALRALYVEGVTWAYRTVENEQNPFFNYIFGFIGGENFHNEESVAFLRDQPLDLIQWRVDSSRREDVEFVRRPIFEDMQTSRMLPPSERGVMRWDKNPWAVVSGDFCDLEGRLESSGVFWLFPYWMGRYCGFIQGPSSEG